MKINSYYPTTNGYIVETDEDTIKLDKVTSPMLAYIQESYSESQVDNLINNIQNHQYEFTFTPSKARAFNNVSSTSLILEDAIIEYEPKLNQKVLEQVNNLFRHNAIASGLYMMNKVSAPTSFNGQITEQQEIQFKTDCATLTSRNMMYTTQKVPLTNRVVEDEFLYQNKGRIYRIPLQYIKEDADQVDVAIREDFGIHIQPTFESLYGHKLTRKSDHILEVETLNHGRYIIETEEVLPEQNELFLAKLTESIGDPLITKICLTEAESFPTPGGYPVVITGVTPINETTLNVNYYRQNGDTYQQQVVMAPEVISDMPIKEYIETLIPYIDRIDKQDEFDKSAEMSQEVLDVLAEDSSKIFRQQRIGKVDVNKGTISKEEEGLIIIDIDTNPTDPNDPNSTPIPDRVVAEVADADGNISKITYKFKSGVLDIMSVEDFIEYYQPKVDQVAFNQHNYAKALELSKPIFRALSKDLQRVTINHDKGNKIVYESTVDEPIKIGDFTLCPPIPTTQTEEPKVEEDGTQLCDTPLAIDYFKSLILPNFQNVKEAEDSSKKDKGTVCDKCGAENIKGEYHLFSNTGEQLHICNDCARKYSLAELQRIKVKEDEAQPRKMTKEEFHKEFGEGANVDVINAGREPEDRIEITEQSAYVDVPELLWYAEQYLNDKVGKSSVVRLDDGQYQVQIDDANIDKWLALHNQVSESSFEDDEELERMSQENRNREDDSDDYLEEISKCDKCGTKAKVISSSIGPDDMIILKYECPKCKNTFSQVVDILDFSPELAKEIVKHKYSDIQESSTEDYWGAKEIDRKGFNALLKFNETDAKGNNYIITNDANEVKRFHANDDKEAINQFREIKEDTWYEELPDQYTRAAANMIIDYIQKRGGIHKLDKSEVVDIIDHITNDMIPVEKEGYDKLYDYIFTVYKDSAPDND